VLTKFILCNTDLYTVLYFRIFLLQGNIWDATSELYNNYKYMAAGKVDCEKCSGCTELIVELQKVKSEILSYGEIIKVLQEELYKKELLNKAGSSDYNDGYALVRSVKIIVKRD
jgi:hypothetical protein